MSVERLRSLVHEYRNNDEDCPKVAFYNSVMKENVYVRESRSVCSRRRIGQEIEALLPTFLKDVPDSLVVQMMHLPDAESAARVDEYRDQFEQYHEDYVEADSYSAEAIRATAKQEFSTRNLVFFRSNLLHAAEVETILAREAASAKKWARFERVWTVITYLIVLSFVAGFFFYVMRR